MTKNQYEKWKKDSQDVREHFIKICKKIISDWYVNDKEFAVKFFGKSKLNMAQLNMIIHGKRMPLLGTIERDLDIYYSVSGE